MKYCLKVPVGQSWKDFGGDEGGQEGEPRRVSPHPTQGESGRWKQPESPKPVTPEASVFRLYSIF